MSKIVNRFRNWFFAAAAVTVLAVQAVAAERLPKYGTPEWKKLPGLTEVLDSARAGDPVAQYLLGSAILTNADRNDLPLNAVDREWEFLAEKNGYSLSAFSIADAKPEDLRKIRGFADRGFYVAQRLTAELMLFQGSFAEAREWFEKAAAQGDDVAQYNLGRMLVEVAEGRDDFLRVVKLWELSGAQGNAGALKDLGVAYEKGVLGKSDMKQAIRYYERAAAAGDAPAAFLLGEIYDTGKNGVPVDKALAIKYYRLAAKHDPAVADMRNRAQQNLVREAEGCRERGEVEQERELLEAAAAQGNAVAKLGLAINLCTGNSAVPKDLAAGLRQLTVLANTRGPVSVSAQGWLAVFLMSEKRYDEAVYWYCRSLGNGNPRAYAADPEFLKKHAPNSEQLELLRGIVIRADCGNERMRELLKDMQRRAILPPDFGRRK